MNSTARAFQTFFAAEDCTGFAGSAFDTFSTPTFCYVQRLALALVAEKTNCSELLPQGSRSCS